MSSDTTLSFRVLAHGKGGYRERGIILCLEIQAYMRVDQGQTCMGCHAEPVLQVTAEHENGSKYWACYCRDCFIVQHEGEARRQDRLKRLRNESS